MAGILDPKERVIDFVLTKLGREKFADDGMLKVSLLTISDSNTFYYASGSLSQDDTNRLFIEASNTGNDLVFVTSGTISNINDTAINNLQQLRPVGTIPNFTNNTDFELTRNSKEFKVIREDYRISKSGDVNTMDAVFQDGNFQHLPNYKYLPPINKISQETLADYPKFNSEEIFTFNDIITRLKGKQSVRVEFSENSDEKNMVADINEVNSDQTVSNLTIIDYGLYPNSIVGSVGYRVFFIGKIYNDNLGLPVFSNIFTVIFE
jgi:hypothetical protein